MEGKIKFYKKDKGFGFIEVENGEDVFFHYSALPQDYQNSNEDLRDKIVTFQVGQSKRPNDDRDQAIDIKFSNNLEESEEKEEEE